MRVIDTSKVTALSVFSILTLISALCYEHVRTYLNAFIELWILHLQLCLHGYLQVLVFLTLGTGWRFIEMPSLEFAFAFSPIKADFLFKLPDQVFHDYFSETFHQLNHASKGLLVIHLFFNMSCPSCTRTLKTLISSAWDATYAELTFSFADLLFLLFSTSPPLRSFSSWIRAQSGTKSGTTRHRDFLRTRG